MLLATSRYRCYTYNHLFFLRDQIQRPFVRRSVFDPNLGPNAYSLENITDFVIATDRENGTNYYDQLQAELGREKNMIRSLGLNMSQTRAVLKDLRYDFVTHLYHDGFLVKLEHH